MNLNPLDTMALSGKMPQEYLRDNNEVNKSSITIPEPEDINATMHLVMKSYAQYTRFLFISNCIFGFRLKLLIKFLFSASEFFIKERRHRRTVLGF